MQEKDVERMEGTPEQEPPTIFRITAQMLRKLLIAVAYLLLFVGFILQICGVAVAHHRCHRRYDGPTCHDKMRPHWWVMFFELIVAGSTGVAMFSGVFEDVILAVLVFLAMVTVKLMDSAELFLHINRADSPQKKSDATRTAAAGYVISSIGNFMLILLIGISKVRIMEWIATATRMRQGSPDTCRLGFPTSVLATFMRQNPQEANLIPDNEPQARQLVRRTPAAQSQPSDPETA